MPNDGPGGGRDPAMSRALDKARQRWPAYTREKADTCRHLREAAELRAISDADAYFVKMTLETRINHLESRYLEECRRDGCSDNELND
jgi:hypothetical protein